MSKLSSSPYVNSRRNYEVKVDGKEKDVLISQLKAHIFELEQHEKDYDSLNSKFRSLQNECALLSEEKLRLEYELRQRSESQNKQILDMRGENENLQLNFNEKMSLNKKLYNDNNNLIKTLEIRNAEVNDLKERLDEWMSKYNKISDEKIGFERSVLNLNDVKASQKIEISRLMEDNQKLSKMYQDADKHNKSLDKERLKLLSKNDELNFELKNVTGKLKSKEDNLNYTQRMLEETKITTQKSEKILKEYEKQIDYQRSEIGNLSATLNRERVLRAELEKSNEKYQSALNDHNKEINRLSNEVEASRAISKRITDEKIFSKNENDKLKNHIMILTENNQKLVQEIELIVEQDERIRQQLSRKERSFGLMRINKNTLEKSLNSIDDYLNRSPNREFSYAKSPK